MKIKGIIFDVDGTLLDSMPIWMDVGARYLKSMGIEAMEGLGEILFSMSMSEGADYLKKTYHLEKTSEEIIQETNDLVKKFYFEEAELKSGVLETLKKIKEAGLPMTIATSTDRELIEGALKRLGIFTWFQGIFTCSEAGAGKEQPHVYHEAAKPIKSPYSEILVVEDGLYALRTAKKAGFLTAGVYDAASEEQQAELKQEAYVYGSTIAVVSDAMKGTEPMKKKTTLTIAGSDSSGGAGIQADIKTMMANGVYAMSAITALTAQNTTGVSGIMEVTPEFLAQQIDCVFQDIRPDAVKIGMVPSRSLIRTIAEKLKEYKAENIVVDPVMVATSGSSLMGGEAVSDLKEFLFPLVTVITPNIPETEVLSGRQIETQKDMEQAAKEIGDAYHCAVLCKGGHQKHDANDLLYKDGKFTWFYGERIENPNTHGTGCTLSSAIASNLAKGYSLEEAVGRAKTYISGALNAMLDLGAGSGPMDHGFAVEGEFEDLVKRETKKEF